MFDNNSHKTNRKPDSEITPTYQSTIDMKQRNEPTTGTTTTAHCVLTGEALPVST
jgi:hypothetical protein